MSWKVNYMSIDFSNKNIINWWGLVAKVLIGSKNCSLLSIKRIRKLGGLVGCWQIQKIRLFIAFRLWKETTGAADKETK